MSKRKHDGMGNGGIQGAAAGIAALLILHGILALLIRQGIIGIGALKPGLILICLVRYDRRAARTERGGGRRPTAGLRDPGLHPATGRDHRGRV